MKTINKFIDSTTMYRLVLYVLTGLTVTTFVLSAFDAIYYSIPALLATLSVLLVVCFVTNALFSKLLKAPTNIESSFITAYILFFIVAPKTGLSALLWIALAGFIAIASKYIIAWNKKHIFNPVAFALVLVGLFGKSLGLWWVGSFALFPFVLIASLLVVKKIRRFPLFFTYIFVSTVTASIVGYTIGAPLGTVIYQHFVSWPLIFFAGIMLTEPLTIPGTKKLQLLYAGVVGVLSSVPFEFGPLYNTPQLALLIGNLLFYPTSLKQRIVLTLTKRNTIAKDTYEFIFTPETPFTFKAGQYLEWMLPHENPDLRGIRRYFTIASAPTEHKIHLGIKCALPQASTYKQQLLALKEGDTLFAGQLAGDFTIPTDTKKKLLFVAGGIGITPFRSILKHLIDTKDKRDIVLFYSNKTPEEIAYKDLLDEAQEKLGIKVVYLLNEGSISEPGTLWEKGFLTEAILDKYLPYSRDRFVYLSGPDAMVDAYTEFLTEQGIPKAHITRDYFSGYAA